MTEQNPPNPSAGEGQQQPERPGVSCQQPYPQQGYEQQPGAVQGYGQAPIGQIRRTGICILLYFVTLGFYSWYWWFKTHDEMKRHSGDGTGGGIALVLAIFVTVVLPFLTSYEASKLYERRGQQPPVSALTGLWYFPGMFIIVGPFIWFVKTNNALNDYWRSLGAPEPN
jgi:Domain of unknown function (DUF4234)